MRFVMAIFFAALLTVASTSANAHAHYRHHHRAMHHVKHERVARIDFNLTCLPDNDGRSHCSGTVEQPTSYTGETTQVVRGRPRYYYDGRVTGGRHAGDPHAFCGAEAARYVFGETRRDLWLAANWIYKFARDSPAPGMAAARSHHVMILMSHVSGSDWMVHDGNSGHGLTREHVRSIAGYVIVDPHSPRYASR
jgi:hypothetical protein